MKGNECIPSNRLYIYSKLYLHIRCVNTLKMTCISATLESADEIYLYAQNDCMYIQNVMYTHDV